MVAQLEKYLPQQRIISAKVAADRVRTAVKPIWLAGSVLAAVVSILGAVVGLLTLSSAVQARLPDFAVLRTLGLPRRLIVLQLLLEGGVIGLWGTVKGLVIGESIMIFLGSRIHPMMAGYSRWDELLLPFVIGLGVAMLGACIPAIQAGRAVPAQLLR